MLEAHAPSSTAARGVLANELDAGPFECFDDFRQGVDDASDIPLAGLHPLNGRKRNAGEFGKLPLIDREQGACRAHLGCSDHWERPRWTGRDKAKNIDNDVFYSNQDVLCFSLRA